MRKPIALLLVLALTLSLLPAAALAAEPVYDDVAGHWAESSILRWSGYHIVEGAQGHFMPDQPLTRGAMAKILANTLGLTDQGGENPFADVPGDAWYAPYVLRCHAAGILQGDGVNANPEGIVTRQEAMVLLCRALAVDGAKNVDLSTYADAAAVADWAAPYVAAMTQAGMVSGVSDRELAPTARIDRASLLAILDRAVVQYINAPGQYDLADKSGTVLVCAGDVTLKGRTAADVLVSRGAAGKNVSFEADFAARSVTLQSPEVRALNKTAGPLTVRMIDGGAKQDKTLSSGGGTGGQQSSGGGGGSGSGGGGGGGSSSHSHKWNKGTVTTQPTCTEKGVKTYTCSGCKQTKTEKIDALGHDWGDWTISGGAHHRTCRRDETHTETGAHTWDDGVVTTKPEGDRDGVRTFTCTACQLTKTQRESGADRVFTQGVFWRRLTDPSKGEYIAPAFAADCRYYINDQLQGDSAAAREELEELTYNASDYEGIPGAVVEFYLNGQGEIGTVKAYIHSVAQLTGDVETRTAGGGREVRIPGLLEDWTAAGRVSGYQDLAKDDVALYYTYRVSPDTATHFVLEKAQRLEGKVVSWTTKGQLRISGAPAKYHARTGLDRSPRCVGVSTPDGLVENLTDFRYWRNITDSFAFYLDKSESICFMEVLPDGTQLPNMNTVAVVKDARWYAAKDRVTADLVSVSAQEMTVTVSKLDGQAAGSAAWETLSRTLAGGDTPAFYQCVIADGVCELTSMTRGSGWGETKSFADVPFQAANDFTSGAVDCWAEADTVFLVAQGKPGKESYRSYSGTEGLAKVLRASGVAVGRSDNPNTAKYVFLSTTHSAVKAPEGYVFLYSKDVEATVSPYTCVIDVVDQNGNTAKLTITNSLCDTLKLGRISGGASTSTVADWKDPYNAVGKFYRIDQMDDWGIVYKMSAVEGLMTMADLAALGDGVLQDSWGERFTYDAVTKFVVIDLAVDDADREHDATDDTLAFSGVSTGIPALDPEQVEDTPLAGTQPIKDATKPYDSVQVAVICDWNNMADYIYILRVVW